MANIITYQTQAAHWHELILLAQKDTKIVFGSWGGGLCSHDVDASYVPYKFSRSYFKLRVSKSIGVAREKPEYQNADCGRSMLDSCGAFPT